MVVHHCTNLSLHVCKDTKEKENKNERKQKNTAKIRKIRRYYNDYAAIVWH